jgi:four helix bundle protein
MEVCMAVQDLRIYQEAVELSAEISRVISEWPDLSRRTIGDQLIRSVDSISSNIAEGYGRIGTGERLQFLFYADASNQEAKNHLRLAFDRELIVEEVHAHYRKRLRALSISTIEFCAYLLAIDTVYDGRFRKAVDRRRAWLVAKRNESKSQEQKSTDDP